MKDWTLCKLFPFSIITNDKTGQPCDLIWLRLMCEWGHVCGEPEHCCNNPLCACKHTWWWAVIAPSTDGIWYKAVKRYDYTHYRIQTCNAIQTLNVIKMTVIHNHTVGWAVCSWGLPSVFHSPVCPGKPASELDHVIYIDHQQESDIVKSSFWPYVHNVPNTMCTIYMSHHGFFTAPKIYQR